MRGSDLWPALAAALCLGPSVAAGQSFADGRAVSAGAAVRAAPLLADAHRPTVPRAVPLAPQAAKADPVPATARRTGGRAGSERQPPPPDHAAAQAAGRTGAEMPLAAADLPQADAVQAVPPLPGAAADAVRAPARVVSMNLCTDLLALRLAAPGQLVSVSRLAQDPALSVLAAQAATLPANSGRAEEMFLLRPDLVLAGTYSNRATVALLRRLGVPVIEFAPVESLADVADRMLRMGAALGRAEAGAAAAEDFARALAALPGAEAPRPRAALWFANGFTGTARSLSGQILAAAGLDNVAEEVRLPSSGILALERLILADPDLVVAGQANRGHSRGEDLLTHPALAALGAPRTQTDRDWICGGPEVLNAIATLRAATERLR